MKYLFIVVFSFLFFYGCGGSGKVTVDELLHNPSFDSNHFLNSRISIYSPYIVNFANQKYPSITEADITNVVLNKVKEKLSVNSNNPNIIIENQTAPDYFRGIKLRPGEGEQLLKNSKSDYLLIIQSVTIGNEIKKRSNSEITNPFPSELKNSNPLQNISVDKEKYLTKQTTQTTIYYDFWDVKKGISVFVIEASVVLVDGLNHKDPYLSIEKVTEALINKISGAE